MENVYVGQKVVCIDATPRKGGPGILGYSLGPLELDAIYTIRWHGYCAVGEFPTAYKVRLEEIYRAKRRMWHSPIEDMPYLAVRFRPLDQRSTDISDLKALLVPTSLDV